MKISSVLLGFPSVMKTVKVFLSSVAIISYDLILIFCVYLIVSGHS